MKARPKSQKKEMYIKILVLLSLNHFCNGNRTFIVNFEEFTNEYVYIPRFWTNSGLSPSAPLPFNRTNVAHQLLDHSMLFNMAYIGALPNFGIKYIRIHWLLSLISFK